MDVVNFGTYQGKQIKWIVTEIYQTDDGGQCAKLLCQQIMADMRYHNSYEKTNWERCSIRSFLQARVQRWFSYYEQCLIQPQKTVIYDSYYPDPYYIEDQLSLLSFDEYSSLDKRVLSLLETNEGNQGRNEIIKGWWLKPDDGKKSSKSRYVKPDNTMMDMEVDMYSGLRPTVVIRME